MPPPHHDHHHHHGHHHPHHHGDVAKYEGMGFKDLPPHLQDAAKTIGWDETTYADDKAKFAKTWHDLSHEQHKAAEQFGYHPKLWDEKGGHKHGPPHHHHDHHHDHHHPPHHSDEKKEGEKEDGDAGVDVSNLSVNDVDEAYAGDDKKEESGSNTNNNNSSGKKKPMFKFSKSYGGDGGDKFDHGNNRHISKMIIHDNGHVVQGLEITYANGTKKAGKTSGKGTTFELERGEFITSVTVRANKYVQSLGFKTNKGNMLGPVGGKGWTKIDLRGNDTEGEEVKVNAPFKYQLCGMSGRGGAYIDQIQFHWGPVPNNGS